MPLIMDRPEEYKGFFWLGDVITISNSIQLVIDEVMDTGSGLIMVGVHECVNGIINRKLPFTQIELRFMVVMNNYMHETYQEHQTRISLN